MKADLICNLILQCLFTFSKLKMLCSKLTKQLQDMQNMQQ